jgi:S1/P1 Nuclease
MVTRLAADADNLTGHDIAGEYRDSDRDTTKIRYEATWCWHFVHIELAATGPGLGLLRPSRAPTRCSGFGGPAKSLRGRQDRSVRDGTDLSGHRCLRATPGTEVPTALRGRLASAAPRRRRPRCRREQEAGHWRRTALQQPSSLLGCRICGEAGDGPAPSCATLIERISEGQRKEWSSGTPADWAMEAFALARRDAYGLLPSPGDHGTYTLPPAYTEQAHQDVALQLSRAGVRLAFVLNQAFTR